MLNGIIIIHKEAGYTSADVVAKMRGICKQKKIGHTGTLDPEATGVLPVCLGSGTKLCDMLTDKDKEYVTELLLGVETDTQDATGRVLSEKTVNITEAEVEQAVSSFQGSYMQVPPMYSAIKVDGKRLYELARAGKEVERDAREVIIHEIEILEQKLPVVKMRVVCSKGTYIRTLCADIGTRLGCGGTMQSLIRTRVGKFLLKDAVTLGELETLAGEDRLENVLLPVESVFENFPALHVKQEFHRLLDNGNSLFPGQTLENKVFPEGQWVKIYWEEGKFAGIYAYENGRGWYKPIKMFLEEAKRG